MEKSEHMSLVKAIKRCRSEAAYWQGILTETGRSGAADDLLTRRVEICRRRMQEQEQKAEKLHLQLDR